MDPLPEKALVTGMVYGKIETGFTPVSAL